MAKMQNEGNLQVTFSKRKTGVFKKSNEIVTLCGIEMLLLVYSPKEKVFSYGHPNVEEIADRFLRTHGFPSSTGFSHKTHRSMEDHQMSNIEHLNARFMAVQEMIEIQKHYGVELDQALLGWQEQRWWEKPVEEMSFQQLQMFKEWLMNIDAAVNQKMYEISNPLYLLANTSSVNHGECSSSGNMINVDAFNQGSMVGHVPPLDLMDPHAMVYPAPPNFGATHSMDSQGQNGYFHG